jgi:hypothetical protein
VEEDGGEAAPGVELARAAVLVLVWRKLRAKLGNRCTAWRKVVKGNRKSDRNTAVVWRPMADTARRKEPAIFTAV